MVISSIKEWLNKFSLQEVKFNSKFLEATITLSDVDKDAAWELYVEMITRIATQRLDEGMGDEKVALESIYSLFGITREILKSKGPKSVNFAKLVIPVLNQIIRPFTAKWHKISLEGGFSNQETCMEFRTELDQLAEKLVSFSKMLAGMAEVEDLTYLEVAE